MKHKQIVSEVVQELEKRHWDTVSNQLADNFTFSGAVPTPINKQQWLGVHRAIQTGIPDLKFNLHDVTEKGDKVIAKVQLSGTNSADMPAPIPGIKPVIPKTNKSIRLPEETLEFSFTGDKISGIYVKPVAHGGVSGVLEQLGEKISAQ